MEVVHVQCGKPKRTTTAQKAMIMMRRVHTDEAGSGGMLDVDDTSPDGLDVAAMLARIEVCERTCRCSTSGGKVPDARCEARGREARSEAGSRLHVPANQR